MTPVPDDRDIEFGRKDSNPMPKYRSVDLRRPKPVHFEEALERTQFGKFNYFLIFICGIILNASLMESCGMSFVMPVSECDLNLSTQDKGILGAVNFAGIISSSHLWGFLADTKGRRRIMAPTLLIAFICSVLSSLTKNFWIFAILRYFNGVFISGSSATVYAYLGEFHDSQHRARAIMSAAVIFGIFCIMLPIIAWLVINQEWVFYIPILDIFYKPWRFFLVVCSLPGLISFFALLILPESPKFTLCQGHQMQTIQILERMNRWNNGGKAAKPLGVFEIYEEEEVVESRRRQEQLKTERFSLLKNMWAQTAPLFKPPYLKITTLACSIQFGFFCVSHGFYMWFPEILNRVMTGVDDLFVGPMPMCQVVMNATAVVPGGDDEMQCITKLDVETFEHGIVLEILYAIGFALIGAIINCVGKLIILTTILFGCGIAGIAAVFVQVPAFGIYLFIIFLCAGLGVTVLNSATVELYPTNLRAMAVCISLMVGRIGSIVGSNIIAFFIDDKCEFAFICPSVILLICGVLTFFIPKIRERPPSKKLGLDPRISVCSRLK